MDVSKENIEQYLINEEVWKPINGYGGRYEASNLVKTRKVNSFSLANIQEIRNLKEQGFKNKDLCIKFRIAKSTLSQIISKKRCL